jgi:dTDP-4-amino-4,6-dideoxygalactose transaminase
MQFDIPYTDLANEARSLEIGCIEAMKRILASGRFILGRELEAFEAEFASLCGVPFAVGTSSGTDALLLTLSALDLPEGAEVITVANSFVATTSAIVLAGLKPVFADIGNDGNLDPAALEAAITPRTCAVLPVHLAGRPARMPEICAIAEKYGLRVIEDAAQAVGARLNGQCVGSFGHAGCFSLNPLKNLYAIGDGGVITTSDRALYGRLRCARSHGLTDRERCEFFSVNSRLDELQAALLRVQLPVLAERTSARRAAAERYHTLLAPWLDVPREARGEHCVYQTYVVRTEQRDALQHHLRTHGVEAIVHYATAIPTQPAAARANCAVDMRFLPVTARHVTQILSLPIFPAIALATQERVAALVTEFFEHCS